MNWDIVLGIAFFVAFLVLWLVVVPRLGAPT